MKVHIHPGMSDLDFAAICIKAMTKIVDLWEGVDHNNEIQVAFTKTMTLTVIAELTEELERRAAR